MDVPLENDPLHLALHSVLAVLYGVLLCIIVFQIGRIFVNKHKLASFQFGFLVLCFFWMILREILLIVVLVREQSGTELPLTVSLPLLLIPLNFQFATYTLLVMFYAQVVYRARWEDYYRRRVYTAWVSANLLFLLFNVIWISLALSNPTETLPSGGSLALLLRFLVPGLSFFVLVCLLIYYGARLYKTLQNPVALVPFRANGSSVTSITAMTVLLCVVFSCRVIYCLIMAYEAFYYNFPAGEQPVFSFISLVISDIIPTFAILHFFRHIPRSAATSLSINSRYLPPAFYNAVDSGGPTVSTPNLPTDVDPTPLLSESNDALDGVPNSFDDPYATMTTRQIIAAMPTTRMPGSVNSSRYGISVPAFGGSASVAPST